MSDVVAIGGDVVLNNCEVRKGFLLKCIVDVLRCNIGI
jgi:hypothetical protein